MIDEIIIKDVFESIAKLNSEMGAVQTAVEWIKMIMGYQMLGIVLILVGSATNIFMTRRNGRR